MGSEVTKVTKPRPPAQVYDFAITPDGAGVPGANGASVIFRFMPDAKEVQSALEVRPPAQPACSSGRSGSASVRVVACACTGTREGCERRAEARGGFATRMRPGVRSRSTARI